MEALRRWDTRNLTVLAKYETDLINATLHERQIHKLSSGIVKGRNNRKLKREIAKLGGLDLMQDTSTRCAIYTTGFRIR